MWSLAWSPAFPKEGTAQAPSHSHSHGGQACSHDHGHGHEPLQLSASYLASASDDATVRVWKRIAEHKWECVLVLGGHERAVYSISWGRGRPPKVQAQSDSGKGEYLGWLASAGGDGKILIWELWVCSLCAWVGDVLLIIGTGTRICSSERSSDTSRTRGSSTTISQVDCVAG